MPNEDLQRILSLSVEDLQAACSHRLVIVPDLDALYEHFAASIAEEIRANNRQGLPTRLILPVGPIGQYPLLAALCNREGISWKNTHTFNMDEYLDWQGRPLPLDDPLSFEGFMRREFFEKIEPSLRPPEEQTHFPNPRSLDEISAQIAAVGGIDTCYGGIGYHGHLAFNEPPISRWYTLTPEEFRRSQTRIVSLAPETIVMNNICAAGGNPAGIPPMAVTLGMADILAARRIRLYCQGGMWQRTVLRIALLGSEDVNYPVTLAQSHPDLQIITDLATAQPPRRALAA